MNRDNKVRIRRGKTGPFFETNDKMSSKKEKEALIAKWTKIIDSVDINKDKNIDFNEMNQEVTKYLADYPITPEAKYNI